ncbi:MAG: 30S ribosomal protein S5 [Cycloclasticus sp.]|nr:30S ribosomal protein S5 [Cycloclasticus sp.]
MENFNQDAAELKEHVVQINRVAKVVKGGRRFSFNAIVIVGDGQGTIGYGLGKANEVVNAIKKGTEQAKKHLHKVSLQGTTIPHPVKAKYGAGIVDMRPASEGTGVIAGGPIRSLCEAAGIHDILCNSLGSSNSHNVIKAAMKALMELESPADVAARRGMSVADVFKG